MSNHDAMEGQTFKASNMVMLTRLSQSLSLPSVFELLTIVPVNPGTILKTSNNSRIKVGFYGVEGAIVTVRFDMKSRGIRSEGGQLPNIVAVDLQFGGKNIHLKISESKILLTGALTEAMGNGAFAMALEHFKMAHGHWTHMQELKQEQHTATINWVCEAFRGAVIPASVLPLPDTVAVAEKHKVLSINDVKFDNLPPNVDQHMAMYLGMFAEEYSVFGLTYEKFLEKVAAIVALKTPIYKIEPTVEPARITNGIYHYTISRQISLIRLAQGLDAMGYGISYHNTNSPKTLKAMLPIMSEMTPTSREAMLELPEEDDSPRGDGKEPVVKSPTAAPQVPDGKSPAAAPQVPDGKSPAAAPPPVPSPVTPSNKKIPAHRFTIYSGGAVRQSSPTPCHIAETIKKKLLADIETILTTPNMAAIITKAPKSEPLPPPGE